MLPKDWRLTTARAAIHEATQTAVIADPHLGYNEARRRAGDAIPAATVAGELATLQRQLARQGIRRLVIAGDVVEDCWSAALLDELLTWSQTAGIDIVGIVPGNHDRRIEIIEARLPVFPEGLWLGDWLIVHGDVPGVGGQVVHGHFHPCVVLRGRRCPCYLVGEQRIVLPAFSRDATGANVAHDPQWRGLRRLVILGNRLADITTSKVVGTLRVPCDRNQTS